MMKVAADVLVGGRDDLAIKHESGAALARGGPTRPETELYMNGPPIENYEALDAGAQIGNRGAKGVVTLLTERGLVAISMKRPVMEQLRRSIERELNENPIPSADADREIS